MPAEVLHYSESVNNILDCLDGIQEKIRWEKINAPYAMAAYVALVGYARECLTPEECAAIRHGQDDLKHDEVFPRA